MTAKMSGEAKLRSTDDSSGKNDAVAPTTSGGGRIEGLDGLRAFAVLAVLAFHLWPSTLPGGGVLGVDVFFVISGYLITTLL